MDTTMQLDMNTTFITGCKTDHVSLKDQIHFEVSNK